MITLSNGIETIELDPDLQWRDEFDWTPVQQSSERSLTGALIIYAGVKSKGRPITLTNPDDNAAWMLRSIIDQLVSWEALPSAIFTLNFHGREFNVAFNREGGNPIAASPITFVRDPNEAEDTFGCWYLCTFRFFEVSA